MGVLNKQYRFRAHQARGWGSGFWDHWASKGTYGLKGNLEVYVVFHWALHQISLDNGVGKLQQDTGLALLRARFSKWIPKMCFLKTQPYAIGIFAINSRNEKLTGFGCASTNHVIVNGNFLLNVMEKWFASNWYDKPWPPHAERTSITC